MAVIGDGRPLDHRQPDCFPYTTWALTSDSFKLQYQVSCCWSLSHKLCCRPCTFTNTTTGKAQVFLNSTGQPATCYAPQVVPLCGGNGDVYLPFGTAAYVGLGASVFFMLVIIELFGCVSDVLDGGSGRRKHSSCRSYVPCLLH